jgi:hypothetical protein
MLRAFALTLTLSLVFAGPVSALETDGETVLAQQKPPAQTPKRDCERKAEGIS